MEQQSWILRRVGGITITIILLSAGVLFGLEYLEAKVVGDLGTIALGVYSLVFTVGTLLGLLIAIPKLLGIFTPENSDAANLLLLAFEIGLVVPAAFGQVCRHLSLQFGGFSGVDGSAPILPPGTISIWDIFALSWLLDAITFNASHVFGWMTTPIQSNTWWSGVLVVIFSIIVDIVLFAGALNVLHVVRRRRG